MMHAMKIAVAVESMFAYSLITQTLVASTGLPGSTGLLVGPQSKIGWASKAGIRFLEFRTLRP